MKIENHVRFRPNPLQSPDCVNLKTATNVSVGASTATIVSSQLPRDSNCHSSVRGRWLVSSPLIHSFPHDMLGSSYSVSHHLPLTPKPLSFPAKPLSVSRLPLPAPRRGNTPRISASAAATATSAASRHAATMYELLSVTENACQDEIKAAFRRLARRCHPDTCRSESRKEELTRQFIEAREAYRILSDPVLREDYDFHLRYGCSCGGGGAARGRRAGFGDWESQLEGLRYRTHRRSGPPSWGWRMRAANAAAAAACAASS
ncbi:hypothetical protein ACLOJK_024981 [Asimina triloba]